jgi:N-methylhydantoinase A/oxoprolinase/acetone carboxylase beta subunit
MKKVRVGIDVGGTFTDAVVIDNDTYDIIAREKIPTTHDAPGGVAEGIIQVLQDILAHHHIAPDEVAFIAHGTTQATNALLEGDVATVGIIAMGSGLEARRVANDSMVGQIPLCRDKVLRTVHTFVETDDAPSAADVLQEKLDYIRTQGAEVIVASESFGVDDPSNEQFVMDLARENGFYATGGHDVSQLYGLRVRTRTAVINGSLIPKMMETADMTEKCVTRAGIRAPLMIMRCDGGVMTVNEVRRRPILTMLSGLAAGVAGALMYEKVSDAIFLEAGGTSTDISVIRNGRVMVRYAQVGGHKTYLNSLDVRTLGVAGGSMIRIENGTIADVGPRSAHIAGLAYEVFSEPMADPALTLVAPCSDDEAVFAAVTDSRGHKVALTLAGAANVLDCVPAGDYAAGNTEAAQAAWQALAKQLHITVDEAARQAMDIATAKVQRVIEALMHDYELTTEMVCLAGGGGSAGVIVPYVGKAMHCSWTIVKNAPIISTIGVALAMVREVVERTVINPSDEDIRRIRQEALTQVMKSGAKEETVEISIEIDSQANILRAVAMGATELRTQDMAGREKSEAERKQTAALSMGVPIADVEEIAAAGTWHIYEGIRAEPWCHFFTKRRHMLRVLDRDGVVRLRLPSGGVILTIKRQLHEDLGELIEHYTEYGTVGGQLPRLYVYYGEKQLDLSGLISKKQIYSVLDMELDGFPDTETVLAVASS